MQTYTHTQGSGSTTWTVTHNFNSDAVAIDVFVDDGPNSPSYDKILPDTVIRTDVNTITVTFSSSRTGVARVVGA